MPSGDDFRKNNLAAVKALSIINNKSSKKYSLLVTSSFSEGTKSNLKSVSKDIHFTGVISEEELLYLLQKSALVMFPTLYEGLGMPILEARETGAKVVCSNLEVFKEISDGTLNYFNPKDYTDIARAINTALKKKGSRGTMNKEYTWPEVAKKFLSFASSLKNKINTPKKRLAVFTPSPSSRSAIGLVTHYSHSELSKLYNVDYFFEDGLYNYKPSRLNTIKYCQREQNKKTLLEAVLANKYDKVIYHLANSEFHVHSILTALKHPGTIILHDTQLKGIFDLMVNRAIIPPERYVASRSIMELSGNDGRSGFIETLINNQNNIICHSEYAKGALADILDTPKTRITKLNLPVRVPTIYPEKASNKGGLTVGFGGILSADKGLELLEKVLKIKGVNATIFGFSGFSESFAKKYKNKINLKTNLTDYEFIQTTKSMDLTINYRKHYNGETSISVLEALSCGTPSIVKDMGWYSELPNKVAFKAKDEDQIVQYIKESIKSREGRGTKNYINYIKYNHSIRKYVEGL
jgi:glycosyltransferase involved in cell wall biosynthesis